MSLGIDLYTSALAIPSDVLSTLGEDCEREANVMLPPLLKARFREKAGKPSNTFVIVAKRGMAIELILCIAEGDMGSYPAMIVTTIPPEKRNTPAFQSSVAELALHPSLNKFKSRVYSVFAPDAVAQPFAREWSAHARIAAYGTPYYAAKITYCTEDTLKSPNAGPVPHLSLRLATGQDIQGVAQLCYQFAQGSEPFVLTQERALEEAELLVRNGQVWVLLATAGHSPEVACIVACTRNSKRVGTITKVCTNARWRGRGYAERLVHYVCQHLLKVEHKSSVVLYVAHDNKAANRVYDKVGFVGLGENSPVVNGVEAWTEIGFDRDQVALGHW